MTTHRPTADPTPKSTRRRGASHAQPTSSRPALRGVRVTQRREVMSYAQAQRMVEVDLHGRTRDQHL